MVMFAFFAASAPSKLLVLAPARALSTNTRSANPSAADAVLAGRPSFFGSLGCWGRYPRATTVSLSNHRTGRPTSGRHTVSAAIKGSPSRGWVRWLPKDKVFRSAVCKEVKSTMHARDWQYAAKPPKAKQLCSQCAALVETSPKSLDGDSLLEFVKRKGWVRDFYEAPLPSSELGSFPPRLAPELLVDVSDNTISCFSEIATRFVPILKPVNRQPSYFVRSGPGWGKTFNLQEVLTWVNLCSLAYELSISTESVEHEEEQRRVQQNVTSRLRDAGALGLARSVSAYCVNHNGETAYAQWELGWAVAAGAGFPSELRVCYSELVDSKKASSATFLSELCLAFKTRELTFSDVRESAKAVLAFCRGQPGGTPLLLVDEVAKVKGVPLDQDGRQRSHDGGKENQPDEGGRKQQRDKGFEETQPGEGVKANWSDGADKKLPDGTYGKKSSAASKGFGKYDNWLDDIRSAACQSLQDLGGLVVCTTLQYNVIRREQTRSGRLMFSAMELSYLKQEAFIRAVLAELAPLLADSVAAVVVMDLIATRSGRDSPFARMLCVLLGGHPRLAMLFLDNLRAQVEALVKAQGPARKGVLFSSSVQTMCWVSIDAALSCSSLGVNLGSLGGKQGLNLISSHALLGKPVALETVAIERVKDGCYVPILWNELGGDGVLLLKHVDPDPAGGAKDLNYAIPSLHPLAVLRMAFLGGSDVRYAALKDMLFCAGSRFTGERVERFVANWCVTSSFARADHAEDYSSVVLKQVWNSASCVEGGGGSNFLENVCVDASAARTGGVQEESLINALKFGEDHPQEAVNVVFCLNSVLESHLQYAVDILEFFVVSQASKQYKVGDTFAAVYQTKDCGADASGSPTLSHVNGAWALLEHSVSGPAGLWDRWKSKIVLVYCNRRPGQFGIRDCPSKRKFESGRSARQSVLRCGTDFGGWLPDPVSSFIDVSQYLRQAHAVETLGRFQKP